MKASLLNVFLPIIGQSLILQYNLAFFFPFWEIIL